MKEHKALNKDFSNTHNMKEHFMGQTGRTIKDGDKVEITFYSYTEPLSSVTGTVQGNYLDVEKGSIPLNESKIYCTEVRIID